MTARSPVLLLTILTGLLGGCTAQPLPTVTIYESPNQIIRLQAIQDANRGKGFSHPAAMTKETIAQVFEGLIVEKYDTALSMPLSGKSPRGDRLRAFGDAEAQFLASLLAKGLTTATPEEVVTFYQTAEISRTQRVITSGAVMVVGGELHVAISNHRAKVDTWQDIEVYDAPYRLTPLQPINPEPGRLLFEDSRYMVESSNGPLDKVISGHYFHVAVRFRDLPKAAASPVHTESP